MIESGQPLPADRTLRKNVQKLDFESGILQDFFDFLKLKVLQFSNEIDKDCVLIFDEMSITPSIIYDTSSGDFVGKVTLPGHSGTTNATHALVFMLGGIAHRWKQTVAYYFTGNSVNGSVYTDIIDSIIIKAETEAGVLVHAVASDSGASNQAMWKVFGITASRKGKIINSRVHPVDKSRKLYFFHDACHAFKNLKEGMLNNQFCILPNFVMEKYYLQTNVVEVEHIKEICEIQKDSDLKLAPNFI